MYVRVYRGARRKKEATVSIERLVRARLCVTLTLSQNAGRLVSVFPNCTDRVTLRCVFPCSPDLLPVFARAVRDRILTSRPSGSRT